MGRFRTAETDPRKAILSMGAWAGLVLGALMSAPVFGQSSHEPLPEPASPELLRVRTLVQANVLGLAERIMEEQGPPQLPDGEWLNWERQLWALYRAKKRWRKLVLRVREIPPAFPASIHREAQREAIDAYNALGQGGDARRLLRQHLLSPELTEQEKITLRRKVIESYLVDGRLHDANAAARVFQSDYRPQDRDWLLLAGTVALRSGNPSEAVNLLAPLDDPAARVLTLWSRLKEGGVRPEEVLERAERMRQDEAYRPLEKPLLAVMATAADAADLPRQVSDLLEQYLGAADSAYREDNLGIPLHGVGDLMESYAAMARSRANAEGYLTGEEQDWDIFARLLPAEDDVMRRGVWAHIAIHSNDPASRTQALDQWVNAALDGGRWTLVTLLFGEDAPLGPLLISPDTALRLSNAALESGDIHLAAEANANVSTPPAGMTLDEWLLYTGRISIIAGRYGQGTERLRQWIMANPRLTPEQTDRVLQPIFELQIVGQHESAIELLELIDARSPGGKFVREIAFWIAESHDALGQHMKAADYFLFSAMQKANGFDQWGISARYRAADALLEGNFFADAKTIFQNLLKHSKDENRISALRQKLQRIWLLESSLAGGRKDVPEG